MRDLRFWQQMLKLSIRMFGANSYQAKAAFEAVKEEVKRAWRVSEQQSD